VRFLSTFRLFKKNFLFWGKRAPAAKGLRRHKKCGEKPPRFFCAKKKPLLKGFISPQGGKKVFYKNHPFKGVISPEEPFFSPQGGNPPEGGLVYQGARQLV